MASNRWQGGAKKVAQINRVTPTAVNSETYTITINLKTITYTADASATVAEITAGLTTAFNASTEPEFAEITATDSTTYVTLTADVAGDPFTNTSSASGAATLVTAINTASTGPEDWSTAANWSLNAVPVVTDDVYLDKSDWDIKYGLSQAGATLTSLTIGPAFTKKIGLPDINADGTTYAEYRTKELTIDATTVNIDSPSSMIRINAGTVQTILNVQQTGSAPVTGQQAVMWRGTHASNVVNITAGQVGVAVDGETTAVIATLRLGDRDGAGAEVWLRNVTLTTVEMQSGTVHLETGGTTLTVNSGTCELMLGNWTTINARGGEIRYLGVGTITTLNCSGGSVVDFSRDQRARTVTTCQAYEGATIIDPYRTVTWSNGVNCNHCSKDDISWNAGENIKVTVANL